eukprot:4509739-Pyramimonas_sp.AAC.1
MGGWMDGWTEGRKDGWTDGRTDGRTDRRTDRRMVVRDSTRLAHHEEDAHAGPARLRVHEALAAVTRAAALARAAHQLPAHLQETKTR